MGGSSTTGGAAGPVTRGAGAADAPSASTSQVGPIDVRSTSLAVLAVIAVVASLYFARSFFAPIVLGVLISYAWYPVVSFLHHRARLPRALCAGLIVTGIVVASGYGVVAMQEQAVELIEKIPSAVQRFNRAEAGAAAETGVLDKLREAAVEIEKAAGSAGEAVIEDEAGGAVPQPTVVVDGGRGKYVDYLLDGSLGVLVFAAQALTVLLLVFFILSSGKLYRQKVVHVTGDTLTEKKLTLQILDEINHQIRRFFFVMLVGAVFVGLATWGAFWWLEVEGAMLWGAIAGVSSIVPYAGPAFVFVASGLSAFVQFGAVPDALLVAAVSLGITSVQGNLLLPWMTSKAMSLNAVAVFVSLLFWGWLWGPIGLVVATPIQMIVKSICDHVEGLEGVGEFLG